MIYASLTLITATIPHGFANITVHLRNFDSGGLIYLSVAETLELATGADVWIQVLGGPVGDTLQVLTNTMGVAKFNLEEPGFFDGAVSTIPISGQQAEF
jgi:hypothetical protein